MNIRMQELETMTEQELRDWFENISERELLAQLDAMAEPERCLLYTSPSPRDTERSRMPSSA